MLGMTCFLIKGYNILPKMNYIGVSRWHVAGVRSPNRGSMLRCVKIMVWWGFCLDVDGGLAVLKRFTVRLWGVAWVPRLLSNPLGKEYTSWALRQYNWSPETKRSKNGCPSTAQGL